MSRSGNPSVPNSDVAGELDRLEQRESLRASVRAFAREVVLPTVQAADEQQKIQIEILQQMRDLGFMGGTIPVEWGGLGLDQVTFTVLLEEMAWADQVIAGVMSMPSSLIGSGILKYGSTEQKERWLRPLAEGRHFGGAGITEPRSGSDVSGLITSYRKDGADYVISGAKAWISNLDLASFFVTLATHDRALGRKGISAFIVPSDAPGVERRPYKNKLGMRALSTGDLVFDEVRLGADALLGEEGDGFRVAMTAVERGRVGVASRAVGVAQACLDDSVAYAKQRVVFGHPIAEYQMTQKKLADMAVEITAARLLVREGAQVIDAGKRGRLEASMAKLYASDVLQRAATEAVQIHGAYGASAEFRVSRMYRDAKIFQIGEGSNEIQRLLIADYLLGKRSDS